MTGILSALGQGYSEEDILGYLIKNVPGMKKTISRAQSSGYGAREILGFLSKNFESEPRKGKSESQINAINNRADSERAKYGLKAAASAVVAPIAASVASSALSRALPSSLKNAITPTSQAAAGLNASQQQQVLPAVASGAAQPQPQPQQGNQLPPSTSQPPVNAPSVPQTTQAVQPQGISTNIIKNSLAYKRQIDALINSGNGPEEIEAYLQKFNPQFIKSISKEGKAPFKDVVAQYIQEKTRDEAMQPEGSGIATQGSPLAQTEAEVKPIAKNATVIAPQGVGEVKEIRNGKAIVEIDGKKHKVDEDELESSPIPEKDLADLYDDLIKGIESETEEDVSRMVQWAGYNPETNTLQFLPHTGDLYTYDNISEEDAALLRDVLSVRKTSGSNFIGAWKEGSKSPIGAALSKLIRKLQGERGGKGSEYSAKHGTIYSAYEPAIQAKKRKKKK